MRCSTCYAPVRQVRGGLHHGAWRHDNDDPRNLQATFCETDDGYVRIIPTDLIPAGMLEKGMVIDHIGGQAYDPRPVVEIVTAPVLDRSDEIHLRFPASGLTVKRTCPVRVVAP